MPGRNLVICPQGETLRPKSLKRNGDIRYRNKLACRLYHVQVQRGGLLEGLSDQESRREERRRQARRQRTANAFRNIRSEPSSGQSARASSCCAGCSRQRAGGPVLPCVQHAEGNEYADDGRAGGRDGRMIVRKPRSRARRHCRTDSTRRESRIWKPQLYYDNPPDIAMSGTLKATFQTVWGRV